MLHNINILLIDDHAIFIDGLAAYFSNYPAMNVKGKFNDGQLVLEFLKENSIDLVLLDISLPEINGLDLCKTIKTQYPSIKVIMLSMHNEPSIISQAIKNGADGYLLKSVTGQELVMAFERVLKGENFYCSEVTKIIIQSINNTKKVSQYSIVPRLSRREKDILRLIIDELTTNEIADKLCLSVKTIEAARGQMLSKVGARNIAGLVKAAYELKLLD
jgi:DNA-binding NarL/FixJ family response regulator